MDIFRAVNITNQHQQTHPKLTLKNTIQIIPSTKRRQTLLTSAPLRSTTHTFMPDRLKEDTALTNHVRLDPTNKPELLESQSFDSGRAFRLFRTSLLRCPASPITKHLQKQILPDKD